MCKFEMLNFPVCIDIFICMKKCQGIFEGKEKVTNFRRTNSVNSRKILAFKYSSLVERLILEYT